MEETLERYRLFVAIEAPEYVKDQIARTQAHLQTIVRNASVSWARREQFHLTLKFLGNVRSFSDASSSLNVIEFMQRFWAIGT